jgi:hypothetical protein
MPLESTKILSLNVPHLHLQCTENNIYIYFYASKVLLKKHKIPLSTQEVYTGAAEAAHKKRGLVWQPIVILPLFLFTSSKNIKSNTF